MWKKFLIGAYFLGTLTFTQAFAHTPKTIAHIFLDLEKKAGFKVTKKDYQTLNHLIDTFKIKPQKKYSLWWKKHIFKKMHKHLKEYIPQDYNVVLLSQALETKKADCDTLSFLYISLGQKYNLPINGMHTKNHFYLNWGKINWETTTGKKAKKIKCDKKAEELGIYNTPIKQKFLPSYIYATLSPTRPTLEESLKYINKAIEIYPIEGEYYLIKASILNLQKKYNLALENINTSLNMIPSNEDSKLLKGYILWHRNKKNNAKILFKEYLKKYPNHKFPKNITNYISKK